MCFDSNVKSCAVYWEVQEVSDYAAYILLLLGRVDK